MRFALRLCIGLCTLPAGCVDGGGPAASDPGVVERDSAGIHIVENSAPVHPPDTWSVGPITPLCSGRDDDRVGQVASILPLDGDTVAVMAGQEQRLLLCAGATVVTSYGGEGEGPGEYRFVRWLRRVSRDTMAVVENGRVTYLDLRSRGVRTLTPPSVHADATRFLGSSSRIAASRRTPGDAESTSSGTPRRYDLFDVDSTRVETPRFQGVEWSDAVAGSGPEIALWAPGATWALSESAFWFVRRNEIDLHVQRRDGSRRIVRSGVAAPLVSDAVWEEARTRLRAGLSDQVPERALESMLTVPDDGRVYPIRQLESAPDGRLWLRLAQADPLREPAPWRVFDEDGRWLTDVQVPPGVQIRHIGSDYLYGVHHDDLDLQTVVMLPIQR